jgi:outer membrane receptor protein involved in Fe transport
LATFQQTHPAVQESLLSYEAGVKSSLFDRQVQLNGAFFYYDYTDKQILGAVSDPLFGALPALVNVPKSHVIGFEVSGVIAPEALKGLTITPAVSFQHSRIDTSSRNTCAPPPAQTSSTTPGLVNCVAGHYYNFDAFNQYADFTNEPFPSAPEWQGSVDAEYRWKLHNEITAFFGGSVNFVSQTNSFFVNRTPTPAFYNAGVSGTNPVFGGYLTCAGAPSATAVGPCPTNHANDPESVPGYALLDLRAGVSKDNWSFQLWARNVTNKWYWSTSVHVNDVLLHYTGQPASFGGTFNIKFR